MLIKKTAAPFRTLRTLIALILCLSMLPAPSAVARAEDARLTVEADLWERELYRDDPAITLTVTTPADCAALIVSQLGGIPDIYGDWLVLGAQAVYDNAAADPLYYSGEYRSLSFTQDNAAITDTEAGRTWTVTADFGSDGVYGLLVTARMSSGEVLSVKAPVYVRYPSVNIVRDGVSAAWEAYILRNSDEAFYFVLDLSKTTLHYRNVPEITMWGRYVEYNGSQSVYCSKAMLEPGRRQWLFGEEEIDPWAVKFASDSPVYGEMVLWDAIPFSLRLYCRSFAGEFTYVNPIDDMCFPLGDVVLCGIGETENERIACSARAAVCYLRGGDVDAALYPEAAVCLERGRSALDEILQPNMTDFDKVKAIHDWMLSEGKKARYPDNWETLSPKAQFAITKTAYGFMSGLGGDCSGWSDTFYMLCSMAGVSCSPLSAQGAPGGATEDGYIADHQFNVAMLDGEVYYFDVFWDGAGSAYEKLPYTYFCMTSAQAALSHTWDAQVAFGPPEAASTSYAVDAKTGERLNK